MDNEERLKRNAASCAGKKRFVKMVQAHALLRKLWERKIKGRAGFDFNNASVYQCAECLFYHIGHAKPDDPIKSWV